MLPYVYINAMLYFASKYSQLWEDYVIFFLLGVGLLLTNVTGNFNLKSSAKMRLNPVYLDPFVFFLILVIDANHLVDIEYVKGAYIFIMINRFF